MVTIESGYNPDTSGMKRAAVSGALELKMQGHFVDPVGAISALILAAVQDGGTFSRGHFAGAI